MSTPDDSSQAATSSKLRNPVSILSPSAKSKKTTESSTRLRTGSNRYQIADVLALAIRSGASDLHLRVGEPPLYRVDGKLIRAEGPAMNMDDVFSIIQAFAPEDAVSTVHEVGHADFGVAFEQNRFRANIFRAEGQWGAALRRVPEKIPTLADILAPPVFYEFTKLPRGLVLATGPTGSGKTTTLTALINQINEERSDVHILTLEDPIEYKHPRKKAVVTQREMGTDFITFAGGLRAALREDPDVIMVGEMRDPETIEAALAAGETGHLVFSTMHTPGAKDQVDRIISAFPFGQQNYIRSQLAAILRGVISQTLMPHSSGQGRVAAFEIMVGTPAVANLIRENNTHQIPSVLQTQAKEGMCTLDQSLAERYSQRLITRATAFEYAQDPKELKNLLEGSDRQGRYR